MSFVHHLCCANGMGGGRQKGREGELQFFETIHGSRFDVDIALPVLKGWHDLPQLLVVV